MRRARGLLLTVAVTAVSACAPIAYTQEPSVDGGTDASPVVAAEAGADAAPLACDQALTVFCDAPGNACISDWSTEQKNPRALCAEPAGGYGFGSSAAPCNGYDIAAAGGADTALRFYYEHASGQLVAVAEFGPSGPFACWGPADFVIPPCKDQTPVDCFPAPDAGADGD